MPRAVWSGSVSFGLVNVPVKLVTATRPKTVRFHNVHAQDLARLKTRRVHPETGEEVAPDEIVRAWEASPGRHVVVSDEELENLDPEASRAIRILDFVPLDQIDPVYFNKTYHVLPDKGAEHTYALLREAMRETGRAGIARVVMRGKEYLVALRPSEHALELETLWFEDEVVEAEDLEGVPRDVELPERELAMAEQLIGALESDWDPERYPDVYRTELLEFLRAKAEGTPLEPREPAAAAAPPGDLEAALEASLRAIQEAKA